MNSGRRGGGKQRGKASDAVPHGGTRGTGHSTAGSARAPSIDALMERASAALVSMKYFEVDRLARRALGAALAKKDYERMARIALPLQEARRQIRQLAVEACPRTITGVLVEHPRRRPLPGCYLVQPPLTAMDARSIREQAWAGGDCVIVLAREPLTRDGLWPVAAVGVGVLTVTTRIKVPPPIEVAAEPSSPTRDFYSQLPGTHWFEATLEALGDRAIASVPTDDHPAHRVLDLMEHLDALPEHEKLHQVLARECRLAAGMPEPRLPRRRGTAWI